MIFNVHVILQNQQTVILIGNYYVKDTPVPEVSHSNGTAVKTFIVCHIFWNIIEMPRPIVEPYLVLLESTLASSLHGRPVFYIRNYGSVTTGDLWIIIPVTCTFFPWYISIRKVNIKEAIIVKIAELNSIAPSSIFNSGLLSHIGIKGFILFAYWDPEIVSLQKDTRFSNIWNINSELTFIIDITKRNIHATFRGKAYKCAFTFFNEFLSFFIKIKFIDSIIICNE